MSSREWKLSEFRLRRRMFLSQNIALMPTIVRGPYFGFAQIFQAEDSMSSNYNALQVKLDKQFSHGLSFGAAYTYSKSIDGASDFFGSGANGTTIFPQNNYDTAAEKGLSDFDIRHRFVFNYIYSFPSMKSLWRRFRIVSAADGRSAASSPLRPASRFRC